MVSICTARQVMVGPHLQDALTDLEDALSDQIAALGDVIQDDLADAEESGAADRERRACILATRRHSDGPASHLARTSPPRARILPRDAAEKASPC
jgi:hypothetical protein